MTMEKDTRGQSGGEIGIHEEELMGRRVFFLGLKKWSKIVIGGALLVSAGLNAGAEKEAEARGAWANRVGGGGAWANRGATWANGGAAWVNRF
jgi:hypothetical protein